MYSYYYYNERNLKYKELKKGLELNALSRAKTKDEFVYFTHNLKMYIVAIANV